MSLISDIKNRFYSQKRKFSRQRENSFSKSVFIAITSLFEQNLTGKAAAMTFYTLTSILPASALLISLINSFGVLNQLEVLVEHIAPVIKTDDYHAFMKLAQNYMSNGAFMIVSFCFSIWGFFKLVTCIDYYTNERWQSEKRSLVKQIFLTINSLIILLLFILISCFIIGVLMLHFQKEWPIYVVSTVSLFIIILLLNFYIPTENVKLKKAFWGAAITTVFLCLLNIVFFCLFSYLSNSYANSYGQLSGLFIVLVWVEFVWIIYLIGVSITCASENHYKIYLNDESRNISTIYLLYLTVYVAAYFVKGNNETKKVKFVKLNTFIDDIKLPYIVSKRIVNSLVACNYVEWHQHRRGWEWVSLEEITVRDLLNNILIHGSYDMNYNYRENLENGNFWNKFSNSLFRGIVELDTKLGDLDISTNLGVDTTLNSVKDDVKNVFTKQKEQYDSKLRTNHQSNLKEDKVVDTTPKTKEEDGIIVGFIKNSAKKILGGIGRIFR